MGLGENRKNLPDATGPDQSIASLKTLHFCRRTLECEAFESSLGKMDNQSGEREMQEGGEGRGDFS